MKEQVGRLAAQFVFVDRELGTKRLAAAEDLLHPADLAHLNLGLLCSLFIFSISRTPELADIVPALLATKYLEAATLFVPPLAQIIALVMVMMITTLMMIIIMSGLIIPPRRKEPDRQPADAANEYSSS